MPKHELYNLILHLWWFLFVVANGACIGSLINVLVYRLPRGISVIWPASACPNCHTKLGWRENFPIFGWLILRGRCRTCRNPISPEYPLVEAFTAGAFGLVFVILAWMPRRGGMEWLGVNIGAMRPEWAWNMPGLMWLTIVLVLILVACLIAMTIVDLKTFTIPAPLTTVPTVLAFVVHPLHAAWLSARMGRDAVLDGVSGRPRMSWAPGYWWSLPTADSWRMVLMVGGAAAGLALAYGLLRGGVLKRSFADYDEWERTALGERAPTGTGEPSPSPGGEAGQHAFGTSDDSAVSGAMKSEGVTGAPNAEGVLVGEQMAPISVDQLVRVAWATVIIVAFGLVGIVVAPWLGIPGAAGLGLGLLVGPIAAGLGLARPLEAAAAQNASPVGQIESDPNPALPSPSDLPPTPTPTPRSASNDTPAASHHATVISNADAASTEIPAATDAGSAVPEFTNPAEAWIAYPHARREMVRELAYLAPAAILAYVGWHAPAWLGVVGVLPHWLSVLGGVMLGYLVGGGVVWLVRILGSLAAGKEAMGLGDVHMMAAVGACLGWIDATLAFLAAAFVGIYFVGVQLAWTRTAGRAMPYGPYLAIATVLVFLGKPWVEQGLASILQRSVNLP